MSSKNVYWCQLINALTVNVGTRNKMSGNATNQARGLFPSYP